MTIPRQLAESLEFRATAMLARYLKRAQRGLSGSSEYEELIARDAYMTGYRQGYQSGGRDCLEQATELNTMLQDRRFQVALATLLQFLQTESET
jgi:hypothetical protein